MQMGRIKAIDSRRPSKHRTLRLAHPPEAGRWAALSDSSYRSELDGEWPMLD